MPARDSANPIRPPAGRRTVITCSGPDDAPASHWAATHPKQHTSERLRAAVDCANLAFWAVAAAHHGEPAAAGPGRFWAVYDSTGSKRGRSAPPIPAALGSAISSNGR